MRRIVSWALAGALVFGGVAYANGRPGSSSHGHHHGHAQTIKLFALTVQIKQIDMGDRGFSLGDQIVFSDDLLTAKGGTRVGFDGGVCTVVRVDDAASGTGTLECPVTLALPSGQLFTVGLIRIANGALTGTQTVAVTGGTGHFRGAQGELAVQFLSLTEANFTISLNR